MNYYPFHIGDFRSGTINMSRQSRWIYRDMLDVYYDTEKPLPLDLEQLCDLIGVESAEEVKIVERLLRFKFTKTECGYSHEICEKIIAEYHSKAETARTNGKRGGRPKVALNKSEKPSGFLSGSNQEPIRNQYETGSKANQEPITNNHKPLKTIVEPLALPAWISKSDWDRWMEYRRKASGKKFTAEAARLGLQTLAKLHDAGNDPVKVIDQSIANGWTGLFEIKVTQRSPPKEKFDPVAYVNRNKITEPQNERQITFDEFGEPV